MQIGPMIKEDAMIKQFSKTSQGPSMPMFRAKYNNEDIIIQEDEIEDGISEQ